MPAKRAPKPPAEKSRPEKLPPQDNVPNKSPQSDGIPKPPPQKELGPEFWVEEEEDFSGLDRQGGFFDIDGSTWNPYDSGYVNHEDNYEDVEDGTGGFEEWDNDDGRRHDGVNEERMTPVEMARRRLAQNTGHDPSTQIPPPLLPQDIIQYYTETWGFNPSVDRHQLSGHDYRYEAWFLLAQDPALAAVGVEIGARVDVLRPFKKGKGGEAEERIFNRIVFRHQKGKDVAEAAVECTHTIAYVGTAHEVMTIADDPLVHQGALGPEASKLLDRAGGSAILSPAEHFVALRSYVAAVAEAGIGNMLRAAWGGSAHKLTRKNVNANEDIGEDLINLPFGFNGQMQVQVLHALRAVAPRAAAALWRDWFMELLDNAPADWLVPRRQVIFGLIKYVFAFSYNPFKRIGDPHLRQMHALRPEEIAVQELWRHAPPDWLITNRDKIETLFGAEKEGMIAKLWEPGAFVGNKYFPVDENGTLNLREAGIQREIEWQIEDGRRVRVDTSKGNPKHRHHNRKVEYRGDPRAVRALHLLGNNLITLAGLPAFPTLEVLDASDNHLESLDGLERYPNLKELNTSNNELTHIDLPTLHHLERLNLSQNRLQAVPDLQCFPCLQEIYMIQNIITSIKGIDRCRTLKKVDLSNNQLTGMAGISACSILQELKITKNLVQKFENFIDFPLLQILDLTDNQIEKFDIDATQKQETLRSLHLGGNPLKSVHGLKFLPSLRVLSIGYTLVSSLGDLSTLSLLEELYIDGLNNIDLAPLKKMHTLQYISLDRARVISIVPLLELPNLRRIDLWEAQVINEEGLIQLAPIIRKQPF